MRRVYRIKMSVRRGAEEVMAKLKVSDILYAGDPARGSYRGFAALHDRCDANMLLPYADDPDFFNSDEEGGGPISGINTAWWNAVSDEVSKLIVARYNRLKAALAT